MEIEPTELHRAIQLAQARERQRCLSKLQEQIDIADGAGDLALGASLRAAKAEIELGVAETPNVALVPTPAAGRVPLNPADDEFDSATAEAKWTGPRDGLAPARERDDIDEGVTIARHLLRR